MFTLVCEKCGREYRLAEGECPNCSGKDQKAAEAPEVGTLPAAAAAPAAPAPVPRPVAATPHAVPIRRRQAMPTWLMSIVFTLAFGGLLAAVYFGIEYFRKQPSAAAAPAPAATLEAPPAASPAASLSTSPYLKYLEVTGLRLTQDKSQKTRIRFLVVNHSGAEIPELSGALNLIPKGGGEPLGRIALKVESLGPYESKEVEASVDTKLKVYELPDWQKLDATLELR